MAQVSVGCRAMAEVRLECRAMGPPRENVTAKRDPCLVAPAGAPDDLLAGEQRSSSSIRLRPGE